VFAGTSKERRQLQRECVHSVAILGTDPLDIPPKALCLLVRLGSPDALPSVPNPCPDFDLMSHLRSAERLVSSLFASGLLKKRNRPELTALGANGLRLTARTGVLLQRSGAGLLFPVALTFAEAVSRFGDECFQELVRLLGVAISPGLATYKREDGSLESVG